MPRLNAKQWTLVLIGALAAANGWSQGYGAVLPRIAVAALVAAGLDGMVAELRRVRAGVPVAGFITALIVAGVASPATPLWQIGTMTAVAILSKHLVAVRRRNVFNPAALGLLVGAIAFGVRLTWWIDSMHLLTIACGSVLLAVFTGRWRMVATFMASFAAFVAGWAVMTGRPVSDMWYLYLGITSFFAFFMATDPKTSPVFPAKLPWFAAIVAGGSFLSAVYHQSSIFLGGLLLGNAATLLLNRPHRPRVVAPPAAKPPTPAVPIQPPPPTPSVPS